MSDETKRDVFGQLLNAYQNLIMKDIEIPDENYRENITTPWNIVYDDALPDDLPLIPQTVAYAIEWFQQNDDTIGEVWRNLYEDIDDDWQKAPQLREAEEWMLDNQDTFTTAWLLGVWHVDKPDKS